MKKQLLPILTFVRIDVKRLFRDKMAMFFTFVFPLLFLFVFGGIFGRNNSSVNFNIALLNRADNQFATNFVDQAKKEKIFKIDDQITSVVDDIELKHIVDQRIEVDRLQVRRR